MAPLFGAYTPAPQSLLTLLLRPTSVAVDTVSQYVTTASVLNKGIVIENQGETQ